MSEVKVAQVNVFPIKSCGPAHMDQIVIGQRGLEFDREWMLIGNKGQMVTQRTNAELSLVRTAFDNNTQHFSVLAPGLDELSIDTEFDIDAKEVAVDLFKKVGTGVIDAVASEYFSEYLDKDVRLVRIKQPRTIKPECHVDGAVTQTGFADGFPLLLASNESLADLNTHLESPITIDSFRANIVVEGVDAYDEDYWREVRIGSLRAFVVRACARCPMPNINQSVGVLPKRRPVTEVLRKHRSGVDLVDGSQGEFFGQNLTHIFKPNQQIHVGDTVQVISRSNERNFQLGE